MKYSCEKKVPGMHTVLLGECLQKELRYSEQNHVIVQLDGFHDYGTPIFHGTNPSSVTAG